MDHHSSLRQWALILLNVMPIPISNLTTMSLTLFRGEIGNCFPRVSDPYWIYYILVTTDVTELNKQLVLISRHMCPFCFTVYWPLEWFIFQKRNIRLSLSKKTENSFCIDENLVVFISLLKKLCYYSAFAEKKFTLMSTLIVFDGWTVF